MLAEIHDAAAQDNAHTYAKAASAASLIVVSALIVSDETKIEEAIFVYAKTRLDYVQGKAKLQSSFFVDWNNWCQNLASQTKS